MSLSVISGRPQKTSEELLKTLQHLTINNCSEDLVKEVEQKIYTRLLENRDGVDNKEIALIALRVDRGVYNVLSDRLKNDRTVREIVFGPRPLVSRILEVFPKELVMPLASFAGMVISNLIINSLSPETEKPVPKKFIWEEWDL